MTRIDTRFAALAAQGRKALVPFFTAGDPSLEATVPVMHALAAAGADVIELGVPFSDPMADGPTIQRSSERALARGAGLSWVLESVRTFRRDDADTPVVLMGYLNPIEVQGHERFLDAARDAGVDGLLLVDSPVEESSALSAALEARGLHQITLVAPTTAADRLPRVARGARGFVYYVSFAGITGADRLALAEVGERIARIRAECATPVAVGFGIKEPAQAASLARDADAVVIGSALVERLDGAATEAEAAARARDFLAPFRAALDAV